MRSRIAALVAVLANSACMPAVMPAPAPVRAPTKVAAPYARTWDAVIESFATRNIPIATIDRTSGLIATDRLSVAAKESAKSTHLWADCGRDIMGNYPGPTFARYNVLVRGDSTSSTILVTVRWEGAEVLGQKAQFECTTRGLWEGDMEAAIAAAATAPRSSVSK